MVANVLCEKHNGPLSSADAAAKRAFERLRAYHGDPLRNDIVVVDGQELERWFLKVMVGLAVSGNLRPEGKVLENALPPISLLGVLFRSEELHEGGLYLFDPPERNALELEANLMYEPVGPPRHDEPAHVLQDLAVHGFRMIMYGFDFRLYLRGDDFLGPGSYVHRPSSIVFEPKGARGRIDFNWKSSRASGNPFVIQLAPPA